MFADFGSIMGLKALKGLTKGVSIAVKQSAIRQAPVPATIEVFNANGDGLLVAKSALKMYNKSDIAASYTNPADGKQYYQEADWNRLYNKPITTVSEPAIVQKPVTAQKPIKIFIAPDKSARPIFSIGPHRREIKKKSFSGFGDYDEYMEDINQFDDLNSFGELGDFWSKAKEAATDIIVKPLTEPIKVVTSGNIASAAKKSITSAIKTTSKMIASNQKFNQSLLKVGQKFGTNILDANKAVNLAALKTITKPGISSLKDLGYAAGQSIATAVTGQSYKKELNYTPVFKDASGNTISEAEYNALVEQSNTPIYQDEDGNTITELQYNQLVALENEPKIAVYNSKGDGLEIPQSLIKVFSDGTYYQDEKTREKYYKEADWEILFNKPEETTNVYDKDGNGYSITKSKVNSAGIYIDEKGINYYTEEVWNKTFNAQEATEALVPVYDKDGNGFQIGISKVNELGVYVDGGGNKYYIEKAWNAEFNKQSTQTQAIQVAQAEQAAQAINVKQPEDALVAIYDDKGNMYETYKSEIDGNGIFVDTSGIQYYTEQAWRNKFDSGEKAQIPKVKMIDIFDETGKGYYIDGTKVGENGIYIHSDGKKYYTELVWHSIFDKKEQHDNQSNINKLSGFSEIYDEMNQFDLNNF